VLIAVGLDPVNEFYHKAQAFGLTVFAAGDASEIAEASAAMFSGKIQGLEIARILGRDVPPTPPNWLRTVEILKSRPGPVGQETIPQNGPVFPVLHCSQEIPCNPCTAVCPQGAIFVNEEDIRHTPSYIAQQLGTACTACEKCVNICPGLAITLVDMRPSRSVTLAENEVLVTIPYEFDKKTLQVGERVTVVDTTGAVLGDVEVMRARSGRATDHTTLVKVRAPREIATRIAGIRIQSESVSEPLDPYVERLTDDLIICRCERVTLAEIKAAIRTGVRDMNEIKALTRAGMGACGSKTCAPLVKRVFAESAVPASEVRENVIRPLFVEIPLGLLAGEVGEDGDAQ
jgi:Fe-S-cluster-containing hydrogenase component 2/bacterioferritin-associated ferredoxin